MLWAMGRNYEVIIFDLDDTIYPRHSGLMQEVGRRIREWVVNHLGLNAEEAATVQHDYYVRYGTTLAGLLAEHSIDPRSYLSFVHDVPIEKFLAEDKALAALLQSIPLRKVIYTNGTADYAWRVLRALGVADYFEQVIGIEEVGLRNKLHREAHEQVLARLGVPASACIMVEDSARNLGPARELGMTTILVGAEPESDDGADFVVRDVMELEGIVRRLLESGCRPASLNTVRADEAGPADATRSPDSVPA
ncbi:MAG: pyrimidine 5'-nucleotidase [Anaerolineae bacterium]|nr:pyrimidine 5'-nucleotidase [Anaerolineae bacterium]